MENFKLINIDQICSIRTYFKARCRWYGYQEEKTGFFNKQKAGFTYLGNYPSILYTADEVNKHTEADIPVFVENKSVYYKPHVEIRMSNESTHTKWFDTQEQLMEFINDEKLAKVNWLKETY